MDKIVITQPHINTDLFCPSEHKWPDLIASVGRLSPEKNVVALISAIAEMPWARLWIFGDGPLRSTLEAQANEVYGDRFAFFGNTQNWIVGHVLSLTEYFVLPSLYDQAPKSLLEAMSAGCLCVVSAQVGVVEDGVTGYQCDPDPSGIRAALERARVDPGRERIREAARKYVLATQAGSD